jgi:hypothetical protein
MEKLNLSGVYIDSGPSSMSIKHLTISTLTSDAWPSRVNMCCILPAPFDELNVVECTLIQSALDE